MDIDKSIIKDMEYDPSRDRYIGKDGSELKVTPYSDGTGYKIDYYRQTTYGGTVHDSTHVKTDLNEKWTRTDNDRSSGSQSKSSGTGCYLTTACMQHYAEEFDDNCYELTTLRWFRDTFVTEEDIAHYYEIAPSIVEAINKIPGCEKIYNYIYENVIDECVKAIEQGDYKFAYNRYKNSILAFEEEYVTPSLKKGKSKVLPMPSPLFA
ncbi:MAG: hypothetical protein IKF01_03205 [Bacilli bacterium]|nr:hypothetical protein [Bacilli bacterium]